MPRAINEHMIVGDIPLEHSAVFVNEHGYSYYSGRLARQGLVTCKLVGQPMEIGTVPTVVPRGLFFLQGNNCSSANQFVTN